MSASKLKITPPPKLEGKNLTIDKLQTWFSGLKNCFKHDKDHKQFLKGEAFESWSALKTDSTRGIRVDPGYEDHDDAATKAEKDARAEEKAVKIQGVHQNCFHFCFLNFSASLESRNFILDIFQLPFSCRF